MERKLHTAFWIQKQNIFILLFLLFSFLSFSQEAEHIRLGQKEFVAEYFKGTYWDAKIVGSNLYFSALISDDECSAGDNYIQTLEIELAGKRLFKLQQVYNAGTDYRLTNANNSCIDEEKLRWNIVRDYPFSYDHLAYNGNNGILYFTIPLPAEFLVGPVTLAVSATHDGTHNSTASYTTPVLPTMPDLRITQGCSAVKLAWNKLSIPSNLNASDFIYVISKDGAVVWALDASQVGYEVKGVTGTVNAKVDLRWKTEIIDSKSIDGSSYDPLSIPAELTASTNRCDGTVELKWQWSQSSPTNFVVYRSDNPTTGFTLVSNTILGTKRSYIVSGLDRGKEYYFKIAAKGGKCPDEIGARSEDDVVGISPADPLEPINAKMSLVTGTDSGVSLTWNEKQWLAVDFQNATDQKYRILRRDLKKGSETIIELPIGDLYQSQVQGKTRNAATGFALSYLDKEVSTCESYSYKILAINNCKTTTAVVFTKVDNTDKLSVTNIDLSAVFAAKNLETSKGYFGNIVQLDWTTDQNADFVGNYKIYRRTLNSVVVPELQITVDKNTRSWADTRALAQTLYEYYVVAVADCGLDKIVSYDINLLSGKTFTQVAAIQGLASGIGFRLPAGIVTGNISYTGGFAVPNVKVVAEKDGAITGNALSFDGVNQTVKINPDARSINYNTSGFSTSVWLKPKVLTGIQTIASQSGVFTIGTNGSKVTVTIGSTTITSQANLVVNTYTNVFATRSGSQLTLYINGKKDKEVAISGSLVASSSSSIYLGSNGTANYFNGILDEFRIYKTALSAADVERDYGRLIQAETPNIVGNWRFDEGFGPYVFDSSKEGGVYNKIDGALINATWSKDVPSKVQLGFAGFSDINGNYVIEGISYNSTGENFNITPTITLSGSIHAFSPSNRILYLGEGSSTENNIDFIDKSSFNVSGSVVYNFPNIEGGTFKSSGSEGISIWIDGEQQAMKEGKFVLTDQNGQFALNVPIGKHFLEFRKDGHTFQSATYPPTGTYDFQDNLSGIEVLDNTKHKLVGRVIGGLVQSRKILGFLGDKGKLKPENQSVNNIGVTTFTLTSVDTRIKRSVETDPETGEFEISLPPKEYEFSDVLYKEGGATLFFKKDIQSVKLDDEDAYTGVEVEAPVKVGSEYVNKKATYNVAKTLTYRSTPSMTVKNSKALDYLPNTKVGSVAKTQIGETTVKFVDKASGLDVAVPTEDLPYPMFLQGKSYQTTIKAVEVYSYNGTRPLKNPATDEVAVLDGSLTVSNGISAKADQGGEAAYQKADQSWEVLSGNTHEFDLQEEGSVNYTFVGGDPDIIKGAGPEDSFVKSISMALKTGDYTIYWPESTNATGLYKGYVTGSTKLPGTDFVTEAPVSIQTTLRMPPGSKSSVTIEKGSTFTTESTNSTVAGGDWAFGIGVAFETEIKEPLSETSLAKAEGSVIASTYGSKYLGNEKTSVSTQAFSESFTISSEDAFDKGDFFISTAKNVEIGRATNINFQLASTCVDCKGPKVTGNNGKEYVLDKGEVYYQKEKGKTTFLYSEDHIKNDIIIKLKNIRNAYFVNNSDVYSSKLDASSPNYGLNNDDPRLLNLRNNNDYTKDDAADDSGNSYVFNRAKAPKVNGVIVDKVRWYNNQIRAWEEILMNNEIEKYTAIYDGSPEKKNISISSGIAYTNTSTVESEEIRLESSEVMAGASVDAEAKFLLGTGVLVGPAVTAHGGGDKTFGWSKSNSEAKAVTTSYTIQDNDPYNVYSLNVYKGKGNDGPIFEVVAGQTSCPFDREKELEVTKANVHYLEYWIGKITEIVTEQTRIITSKYAANVPFGYNINPKPWNDQRDEEIVKTTAALNKKKDIYNTLFDLFKNNSKPLLGARTVQIQKPGMLVNGNDKATMRNVPSSKAAVFDLELRNETELLPAKPSDAITYQLSVDPASNPDGLVVLLNGENLVQPIPISIPFGQKIRQTITVLRGPKLYNYKDLTLIFESPCDGTIQKMVTMDIDYIPVCAEASIESPGNKWTVNYDANNKLALKVGNYDVNYQGFKGVKIQYKRANESETSWKLLEMYYRDADARLLAGQEEVDRKAPLLTEQGGNDFIYSWDVSKLNDDLYDVRIQSICSGDGQDVVYTSPTISGIIDRINPSSFGAPQPSDGVLSSGDEIMIQFNEPINAGLLNPFNFDIRGVVQGGKLSHPASVYFNGANDYMEIPEGIQLNRRSFSFDFYAKRSRQGAEVLISQGVSDAQALTVGFNGANQFEVNLAGMKIKSNKTIPADDTWVHYAYAYDASIQEAILVINGLLDTTTPGFSPNYEAVGKILVGKDGLSQKPSFEGNIHELRFWGKALSVAQINVAATKRLKNNEPGLLGNWPMEETEGVLAKDIVRERHATIVSGTWQVALKGNALVTNALATPTVKSPAYLDVSDFSIEFWFKGNGTTSATLLSNGKGDNSDLNTNGWSVNVNSSGLLEVRNNNNLFNASTINYFDNQWHHFALVVNRMTNTVCYIDGNQQNSAESKSLGFSGFGGAALHLGSMGWVDSLGITQQAQRFSGALDEIRVWQGARTALQIKRDMRYMLSGDEAGLDLYLPFDKYENIGGIETLKASNTSAATGLTAVRSNGVEASIVGTVAYMQNTPLVKLPRPVRKVNFSYSANQDKIILTTSDADAVLENVILDISVSNVQDINGNTMRAPVTWTAYVDKNQVVWTESDKHFAIESGKGFTFETTIKNTGGKLFNYSINNLPSWLTASPRSGVLSPVSSKSITFTVDKDVNIGNYVQDILLETEFGFAEVLNLSLDVYKPLPADWKYTASNYQYSMNFIAQLSINGEISRDPNDQVAAFVGGECRGIAKLRYIEALDKYEAYISVYSNRTSGDAIEFRIWNASDGQVHRDVTPTYVFESNGVVGTAIQPLILKAVDVLEYTYDLPKGWTWISTHLDYNYNPNKQLTTNDLLKQLKAENGDLVRTIDVFDGYDTQAGWTGTISAKGGIKSGKGYKIFLSNANQLKYNGLLLKGDQVKIDVVKGWNWIGYVGFKNTPINQALAGFGNVSEGDVIKNQYNLAIYTQNVGWVGDLTSLKPGEGYMMKTAQAGSFFYPNLSYSASTSKSSTSKENIQSSILPVSSKYSNTMNAVAEVVGDNQSMNNRLRAYVGTELRGETRPVFNPLTKKTSYFVTVYGQLNSEKVRFEFVDDKDSVIDVNEVIAFEKDVVLGALATPTILTLKGTFDTSINSLQVSPNPFSDQLKINFYVGHTVSKIVLVNVQGRILKSVEIPKSVASYTWGVEQISSGVYILLFYDVDGNVIDSQKVIKK